MLSKIKLKIFSYGKKETRKRVCETEKVEPVAVAAIVKYHRLVLVGRKRTDESEMSNLWHLPGGLVKERELPEDAIRREILEESGLEVKIIEEMGDVVVSSGKIVRWYLCEAATQNARVGSDLVDLKFIPLSEVVKHCDQEAIDRWPRKVKRYLTENF